MSLFSQETVDDLLFTVRYMPKMLTTTMKYSLYGAICGFGTSCLFQKKLSQYAQENHDAVDLTDSYVANDEEHLMFSRNQHFNKQTPPISEFLPFYGAFVGACSGLFFSLGKLSYDFKQQLDEEKQTRKLSIV